MMTTAAKHVPFDGVAHWLGRQSLAGGLPWFMPDLCLWLMWPVAPTPWGTGAPWVEEQQTKNWPNCTDHPESAHQND